MFFYVFRGGVRFVKEELHKSTSSVETESGIFVGSCDDGSTMSMSHISKGPTHPFFRLHI